MKSIARTLSVFSLVQWFLISMGFLLTRALVNAREKSLIPELKRALPLHWWPETMASVGLLLWLVPVIYALTMVWLARPDPSVLLFNNTIARTGWIVTIALGAVMALSVGLAFKALFGPPQML
jgi:hypothetical protein